MYSDFVNLDNLISEINNIYETKHDLTSDVSVLEPEREINFYYSTAMNPYCSPNISEMFMMSLQRTAQGRTQNAKKIDNESIHSELIQNEIYENEIKIRSYWNTLNTDNNDVALTVQSRKDKKNRTKVRSSSIRLQIGNLQMLNSNYEKPASRLGNLRSSFIRLSEKQMKEEMNLASPRELCSSTSILRSPIVDVSANNESLLSPLSGDSDEMIPPVHQEPSENKKPRQRIVLQIPTQPAAFGKAPERKLSRSNLKPEIHKARTGSLGSHIRKSRASISSEFKASDVVIPEGNDVTRRSPPTGNRRRPTRPPK
ncbi:hypothetical protein TVAG_102400 [Trichomonas vaginalis G3]|uniref:Uncharacterized protein n=1 Tax=Trichomonas vaginalis (strain ATCC PRA-98 / G3) TaxID=412133 RepID=A2ECU6_TRIV3|nr:hypothetical protein TVAGG3_0563980 [Trichomonas vaginalis G3]EAY09491.1 hypothetical protein TVAG_102400 [Trichomonas vaginalis G3]KAI5521422.1 hypothetical protein TVAGG3_0563980 [Trichomonas vaginalis G3]|eukprot:XP_001321714.1 hypothetical protein [Trichomonas vaginalis G3]